MILVATALSYIMSENPPPPELSGAELAFTGVFSDNFDRAANDEGLNDGEVDQWIIERGGWGVQVGVAFLPMPDADRNLAVVDVGSRAASVSALIGGLGVCGVVARYADERNYVALVRVPAYGVWNVVIVTDGLLVQLGKLGDISDANVPVTLAVADDLIVASVGGREATFVQKAAFDGTSVGLIGEGGASSCAWDNFVAQVAR